MQLKWTAWLPELVHEASPKPQPRHMPRAVLSARFEGLSSWWQMAPWSIECVHWDEGESSSVPWMPSGPRQPFSQPWSSNAQPPSGHARMFASLPSHRRPPATIGIIGSCDERP